MKDLPPEQAERVREAMRDYMGKHDLTKTAFARLIGRSQPTITGLLSGKDDPSFETAKRVAAVLRVPVGDLLGIGLPHASGLQDSTPDTSRVLDESVSAFERAAMLARNSGISEESIAQAGKMRAFSGSASFRETDYLAAMLAAERERLGKPTPIEVVPEEPEDDPAARLAAAKKKARR